MINIDVMNLNIGTLERLVAAASYESNDVYNKLQNLAKAYQENPSPETRAAYLEYKSITFPIRYGASK